jgi:hypothetical protein
MIRPSTMTQEESALFTTEIPLRCRPEKAEQMAWSVGEHLNVGLDGKDLLVGTEYRSR